MALVTKEEIKKIAEMTKVSFEDHELEGIIQQFNDVIGYAQRVSEIAKQIDTAHQKNINCVRIDQIISTETQEILNQAPQAADNYFVVPKFVDNQ